MMAPLQNITNAGKIETFLYDKTPKMQIASYSS